MITFQDKVSINTDPSIADINKIKDSDINALKAGVNANETNITNIKSAMSFLSTEVKTNETWIDGKPIYRRVLSAETTTHGEQVGIATNFTNEEISVIDNIWANKGKSFLKRPGGAIFLGVGLSSNDGFWFDIRQINSARTLVNCMVGASIYSGSTVYITIEYTKTTDVAS